MTLIEFFDECQVENAIAGLRFLPEKIVFVGYDILMTEDKKSSLKEFFKKKSENIIIDFEKVDRNDYASITKKLNSIIDSNTECVFDLTGGKELVLVAMGAVSAERNVPMIQFNVRNGNIHNVSGDADFKRAENLSLTIEEMLRLNGSALISDNGDFNLELTTRLKKDIATIWKISTYNFSLWNRQVSVLKSFEKQGSIDKNLCVRVDYRKMKNQNKDVMLDSYFINGLTKAHILCDYKMSSDGILSFRYRDEQLYKCFGKAGNILELYSYMLLCEIAEENPGYYDDIDRSVFIDWDGKILDRREGVFDTRNEVDLVVMRDLVPIFISCKNGEVDKNALYELDTVSRKCGGKYAKRVLIASFVSEDINTYMHISQRAKDMSIVPIFDIDRMSREQFKETLKNKIR